MRYLPRLLLMMAALAAPLAAGAAQTESPRVTLTGVPTRVFSGSPLSLRLGVSGLSEPSAKVEVTSLLVAQSGGSRVWEVALDQGKGEQEIRLSFPEVRNRVSLRLTAKLLGSSPAETAQADAVLLPRWSADRLAEALRTTEIGVVDGTGLIAPALGPATFVPIAPASGLGVERFRGDLLIVRLAQFSPSSEEVVTALAHQLLQGRSVIWLVDAHEPAPSILHSGPLEAVSWPFTLRPGHELSTTKPEELQHWAGTEAVFPLPRVASFRSAWLIVCSDQLLTTLAQEPAAGWLWEEILRWVIKKPAAAPPIQRLRYTGGDLPPSPSSPTASVLDVNGPEWVQPDEPHLEWLGKVRRYLEKGNSLLVLGAEADRASALSALGAPSLTFLPVTDPPDLLLGPNLLLWRIARTNPAYGLLVKRGEKSPLKAFIAGQSGPQVFAEFPVGKGLLFLSQPDWEESVAEANGSLAEHLAQQLLAPPGRSLLEEGN